MMGEDRLAEVRSRYPADGTRNPPQPVLDHADAVMFRRIRYQGAVKSHQVLACHGLGVREFFHGPTHESHVVRDGVGLLAQPLDLLLLPQFR